MSTQRRFPYLKFKTRRTFILFLVLLGIIAAGTVIAFASTTADPTAGTTNTTTTTDPSSATTNATSTTDPSAFTNQFPSNGSTSTTANPKISVYVKSASSLNSNSLIMNLNGSRVPAQLQYKGSWVDDYYEGTIWVIDDYREGTISYEASGLKDGVNTVDITITDSTGNVLKDTWSFTIAEPPLFNSVVPAENSQNPSVNSISAIINDNSNVDWNTLRFKINSSYIDTTKILINRETGMVTYTSDFPNFSNGAYNVTFEVKDSAGNLGTKSWAFNVDSSPPEITSLQYFQDQQIIPDGKFKFYAQLSDTNDIKDNATLTLNGTQLKSNFEYEGYTDYYGDDIVTSKKSATISYEEVLPNGRYTLSLFLEDALGNKITRTWSFSVSAKPEISNETPTTYGVQNLRPVISAIVKSPNGSGPVDSIVLKLDGETVSPTYDVSTGNVSYTPSEALENEKYHIVNLTVTIGTDTITKEWRFYTNTYPDMPDSNIENCLSCHQTYPTVGSNGIFEDVHASKLSFSGTHSNNNCQLCHDYISIPADCVQCHSDPNTSAPKRPHGSTPSIKYQPAKFDTSFPLRVTENREMWDCIVCHQPGTGVGGTKHDIPELHKSAADASCTKCHARSLTREHARERRTDQNNNKITCNTCHKSTNPLVVKAITDKNTACSACHTDLEHEALHVTQLEDNCSGCHNKTLSTEHIKRGQTCETCHNSTDPKVVTAITNENKTCSACHENAGHKGNHDQCIACHSEGSSYNR